MLHDPRKERPQLTDIVAWAETLLPDLEYDWSNAWNGCPCARYLLSRGIENPARAGIDYKDIFGGVEAYHRVCRAKPWNFGAFVARGKAEIARRG